MARFCTSCGAEAALEDRFCSSCGAALRTTGTRPPGDSRPAADTGRAGGEPADRERTRRDSSPARTADTAGDQHRDVFVSYAEEDLTWAEWIGWHLEEATFRVVLQAWDSVAGRNWVADVDDGIQHTDYMVVVASGAYFSSPHTRPQWTAVVAGGTVPIIPVLVEDIQIPGLLATHVPIALGGRDEENARTELLGQMRNVLRGRAKPTDRPPIPARERAVPTKPAYPPVLLIAGMGQDSADETSATPDDSTGSGSPGGDGAAGPGTTPSEPGTVAGNGTSGSFQPLWNRPYGRVVMAAVATVATAAVITTAVVSSGSDDPTSALNAAEPSLPVTAIDSASPTFDAEADTQAQFEANVQTIADQLAPFGCRLLPNWHKNHTYSGGYYVFVDDNLTCDDMALYSFDGPSAGVPPTTVNDASACPPGPVYLVWQDRVLLQIQKGNGIPPETIRDVLGTSEMTCGSP